MDVQRVSQIAEWIRLFVGPDQWTELRALGESGRANGLCPWYRGDQAEAMAAHALRLEPTSAGVYFTPNPLTPPAKNQPARAACDTDVASRSFVLVDIDPVRPAGTSATDTEKSCAYAVLCRCLGSLEAVGIGGIVVADSGNGYHMCVPVSLPNDDQAKGMVKQLLDGLHARCSDDRAHVDTCTFNAARIWRLYGTIAKKGDGQGDRPWRQSAVLGIGGAGDPEAAPDRDANTEAIRRLLAQWEAGERREQAHADWREDNRVSAYLAAAVEDELARVRDARPGGRNTALNAAAFALGQLVGDGWLGRVHIEGQLLAAALGVGLGEKEARRTIRNGLRDGAREPRGVPEAEGLPATPGGGSGESGANGHAAAATAASVNGQGKPAAAPAAAAVEEPWPQPIPLNSTPDVLPFPLEVLPGSLRRYVEECAWATNSPIDYVAVPMLAVAGGAIGNSRVLEITRTHRQLPCLFTAVVGPPGSGKSPALDRVMEPMELAGREYRAAWKRAMLGWESAKACGESPPKPVLRRCLVDDATSEAVMRILGDNPRGLAMVRDELSALITGMNQYKEGGKGSDRQIYLKVWSGGNITVDRKNLDGIPLVCRRPFLSIAGGLQPDVVEWLRGEKRGDRPPPDDGFLDRFLVAYPHALPARGDDGRDVAPETTASWERVVYALLALEPHHGDDDGEIWPQTVRMSVSGRAAWQAWTHLHAAEVNALDFPDYLRGPWAKMTGYCGRLALILHLLYRASGETELSELSDEDFEASARLIAYFKSHATKLHAVMGSDPRIAEARRILQWIQGQPDRASFSRSDVYVDVRRSFGTPEDLDRPLAILCQYHWIRPETAERRSGPGRKPTTRYQVSPLSKASGNPNNPNN